MLLSLFGFWGQETGSFKFAKRIVFGVLMENGRALERYDYVSVSQAIFERAILEGMHDGQFGRDDCLETIQSLLEANHAHQGVNGEKIAGRIISMLYLYPERYGRIYAPVLTIAQRIEYGSDCGLNDR